ncbi:MAG: hemin receptor [Chloroflexi bacterium]|nr:hemin receptor [Chloroflexota bacterium]
MTLTDEQRQLVTSSFARLVPITAAATSIFYSRLWDLAPETRPLFRSADMTQQGLKLMQTLGVAVRALHDLDSIRPFLHDLGRRHQGYGVTKEQFEPVRSALLWMIEQCLKDEFSPATRQAWSAAYDLIADMTIEGFA